MSNHPTGKNHMLLVAAIVLLSSITPALLTTAPIVAAQLGKQLSLAPTQVGSLFSAEMGAMSLATLPSLWWLRRVNWKLIAVIAAVVFIVGNLLSAHFTSYVSLLCLRFMTALSGGTLMIVCKTSAASMPNPSRVYGLWVTGQLVLGAIGLWVLPAFFGSYGISALFIGMAALMVACLPLVFRLPDGHATKASTRGDAKHYAGWARTLAAILMFYVSLSAMWTFISGLSGAAHLAAPLAAKILSAATLVGIAGSLVTGIGGQDDRMSRQFLAGFGLMLASIACLYGTPGIVRFAIAVLAFKFSWTYVLPLMLGKLANQDPSGRAMSFSSLVIGGGLAIGPLLGGALIQTFNGYDELVVVSFFILVLSAGLIMAGQRRSLLVLETGSK
ncbi:MFS transporter [Burkholderia cepacia]|uniref:MFS transporter n=1 Tax=Burkholderia cepacia TaxID=292 RepID=UPI001CF5E22C|nr:MFS transporter [Burkholderia cepacia]MCA8030988.1 MFS transporter [Burkholderia cepacia]